MIARAGKVPCEQTSQVFTLVVVFLDCPFVSHHTPHGHTSFVKIILAQSITGETNSIFSSYGYQRAILDLDGWLSRTQLDAFPDAKLAHDWRHAHWTFEAAAYVDFVQAAFARYRSLANPPGIPSRTDRDT
jgi:hypothetical protein